MVDAVAHRCCGRCFGLPETAACVAHVSMSSAGQLQAPGCRGSAVVWCSLQKEELKGNNVTRSPPTRTRGTSPASRLSALQSQECRTTVCNYFQTQLHLESQQSPKSPTRRARRPLSDAALQRIASHRTERDSGGQTDRAMRHQSSGVRAGT